MPRARPHGGDVCIVIVVQRQNLKATAPQVTVFVISRVGCSYWKGTVEAASPESFGKAVARARLVKLDSLADMTVAPVVPDAGSCTVARTMSG